MELVTVKIDVGDHHIEHGIVEHCYHCPGTLSIAEKLQPEYAVAFYGYEDFEIYKKNEANKEIDFNENIGNFCIYYDYGAERVFHGSLPVNFSNWQRDNSDWNDGYSLEVERPAPISFEVDLPKELLR